MNVFRKEYRPLSDAEKKYLDALKGKAQELYDLIEQCPTESGCYISRELPLAKTNLEQAVTLSFKYVGS